jgi:hypothetical protein
MVIDSRSDSACRHRRPSRIIVQRRTPFTQAISKIRLMAPIKRNARACMNLCADPFVLLISVSLSSEALIPRWRQTASSGRRSLAGGGAADAATVRNGADSASRHVGGRNKVAAIAAMPRSPASHCSRTERTLERPWQALAGLAGRVTRLTQLAGGVSSSFRTSAPCGVHSVSPVGVASGLRCING